MLENFLPKGRVRVIVSSKLGTKKQRIALELWQDFPDYNFPVGTDDSKDRKNLKTFMDYQSKVSIDDNGKASPKVVGFTKEEIKTHIDTTITFWRFKKNEALDNDDATEKDVLICVCYIDAYQSLRISLFGELLPVL